MSPRNGFLALALVALLTAGCGSEPQRPTEQLTRAQTLVEQAEKSEAQKFAAAELETARNKLSAANKAADKGKQGDAIRLANEAALDAEYATARASAGKTQQAATELSKSTETLREEATRSPAGGTGSAQPAPSTSQPMPRSTQPAPATTQPVPTQPVPGTTSPRPPEPATAPPPQP